MTWREPWADGPEDQPSPAFRPDCPRCRSNETWFVGVHRGQEMFQCLKCGSYFAPIADPPPARVVCDGWAGVHADRIVLHDGPEPVTHGMCDDCERAVNDAGGIS